MGSQSWTSLLDDNPQWTSVSGAPLSGSTTETVISPPDAGGTRDFTIGGGTLKVGSRIKVIAKGRWTVGTTATGLTFTLRLGGSGIAGTSLAATGAIPTSALTITSLTNGNWALEVELQVRAIGSAGTILAEGRVKIQNSTTAGGANVDAWLPLTGAAATTVDLTANSRLVLTATLSQTTGAPSVTCDQWDILGLNI